ncbi:MAG: DNA mismatch repair protein MutS [Firmicutes bacterium]|nr:DNA mismatch repair protein MutS [Bacillota bacterium]
MSNVYYEDSKLVVDLHQLLVDEAKILLIQQLDMVPSNIKEVKVIHGFHHGGAILDMLNNNFKHKRISRKYRGMNKGITIFYLK